MIGLMALATLLTTDYFNEEKTIRSRIINYHQKRYTNPIIENTWLSSKNIPKNPKPVKTINFSNDERIVSNVSCHDNIDKNLSITCRNFGELIEQEFDEGELPKAFKDHWEQWVKSEVLENEIDR